MGGVLFCAGKKKMESKSLEQRFWEKVNKDGPTMAHMITPCWIWKPYKDGNGYGMFSVNKINRLAHRVSFEINVKPIPFGMCVLHRCDNPSCVRPDHLWIGTQLENIADRDKKGRQVASSGEKNGKYTKPEKTPRGENHGRYTKPERTARGERNGQSKLTDNLVLYIRERHARGDVSLQYIATEIGISRTIVWRVVRRKSWKHI
jgi:hypothetical protein